MAYCASPPQALSSASRSPPQLVRRFVDALACNYNHSGKPKLGVLSSFSYWNSTDEGSTGEPGNTRSVRRGPSILERL